jgi:hypothetical protein
VEQPRKSRAVHVGSGEAAVIIEFGQSVPSFAPLALDEGLGGFALRVERVEFLIEAFFGRFPRVDRAAQARGCWFRNVRIFFYARRRSFRSLPAGRVRPKNARPFQRVPVTATAMALSEG